MRRTTRGPPMKLCMLATRVGPLPTPRGGPPLGIIVPIANRVEQGVAAGNVSALLVRQCRTRECETRQEKGQQTNRS